MDIILLRTLHVAGVIALFMSIGSILTSDSEECRKKSSIMHGIALLLIGGIGFYMLFSLHLQKSGGWWHVKVLMWLFLGAAPALAKRKVLPQRVLLLLCLAAGIFAAYLGLKMSF